MVTDSTICFRNIAEKFNGYANFITLSVITAAALLLVAGGSFIPSIAIPIQPNAFINTLATYQVYALLVGLLTMSLFLIMYPRSKRYLRVGNLSALAIKEKWLGINGRTTWVKNGLQLLVIITIATGIFMFLGVSYTNSLHNFQTEFIPYILLFSFTNSLAEELIFRFGLIAGMERFVSPFIILLISAVLFGLPHYAGNPGGVVGVLMSAVLGYILCKATLETKGIGIAWFIHFVQDVIIFTAILMMSVK